MTSVSARLHEKAELLRRLTAFPVLRGDDPNVRLLRNENALLLDLLADAHEYITQAHEHAPALRPVDECWPCALLRRIEEIAP